MTTTVLISVAASVVASLFLILVVLVTRRRPLDPDDEIARIVAELNARMDAMSREVSEALARTAEETRRSRVLGELGGTIEVEEVLSRTLDAAGALNGVDAALVHVLGGDDETQSTALGITPEETAEYWLGGIPTGHRIRSLSIDYGEAVSTASGGGGRILRGTAVPIRGEQQTLGLLGVFSRRSRQPLDPGALAEVEALVHRAGPAIENALRFREARQRAELDALTGLHNHRFFHETLARETARAQRYNRRLTLIVLDLDDFKEINDRIGHLAGDSVLTEVADRIRGVVRHSDIACRVGGDEFAVILPESTIGDAELLHRRIQSAVSSRPISNADRLLLSAGIAELRPQDDPVAFFQRADDALYRAKAAGKGRVARESEGIGGEPLPPVEQPLAFGHEA